MNHAVRATPACCKKSHAGADDVAAVCFHCHQTISPYTLINSEINGDNRTFCSPRCKQTAAYIADNKLADFYTRRDKSASPDQQAYSTGEGGDAAQWSSLDDQLVAGEYVRWVDQHARELILDLPGLYCASCSWLIDKAMQEISPTISTHIDASAKRAWLTIADPEVALADLVKTIDKLGYRPSLVALHETQADDITIAIAERRQALQRIAVAGFGMMQVMTYAVALYFGDFQGMAESYRLFFNLISMLVATVVVFYSGKPFFDNAWNDIKHLRLGMDVPIALAIAGAYFPSVYQTLFRTEGHVYFDSAVMFIFFLSLGRYVETSARHRMSTAPAALSRLLPLRVSVSRPSDDNWTEVNVDPRHVQPGDRLRLCEQQVVPFDGRVVDGEALVDESIITGESAPISCSTGQQIMAGTRLLKGAVEVVATKSWADSSIARIEQMLRSAQGSSQQQSELLQQVARYFVAAVLVVTLIAALFWWLLAPERVFQVVLAMLVASCPCAFSLAAPIGATAASHALRAKGLLLSNFQALKLLPKVTTWCFDKTGTITRGKPSICRVDQHAATSVERCLAIASALEGQNQHVLSAAFSHVESDLEAQNVENFPGRGIRGQMLGETYYLGKPEWLLEQGCNWDSVAKASLRQHADASESSMAVLGTADQYIASFMIEDEIRPRATKAIKQIKARGHTVIILSGDRLATVRRILNGCDIDLLQGDLLPQQKTDFVRERQAGGEVIAMVGDGINDAPVIAQADVSIAMASGSELSQSQADVLVLNGRLDSLTELQDIATLTQAITRQNLIWALLYNLIALPLAAGGMLTPWIAALGMSLSSLLVVLNALRIAKTGTQ